MLLTSHLVKFQHLNILKMLRSQEDDAPVYLETIIRVSDKWIKVVFHMKSLSLDTVIRLSPVPRYDDRVMRDHLLPTIIFCDSNQTDQILIDQDSTSLRQIDHPTKDEFDIGLYSEWKALLDTYQMSTPEIMIDGSIMTSVIQHDIDHST